jgi:PhnB protein
MSHPIPDGYHTITPHLVIKGAAEAIEFYTRAFGAEGIGRMPLPAPGGQMKLGHAELQIGDSRLFLADEFPDFGSTGPSASGHSPVTIHLYVTDADAAFARAVEAGAKVAMPLADQFWGDRYGKLVDPFGHHWSIATHLEDLTPEQMKQRMAAAFGGAPCESK